jgi:alpha-1,3-rhamnosyltransferase
MERRVIVEMNNQPLVSVPVITYNSAKFVLETLESIKAQTYQNIELIISDDCSTDNTVELCQKWVEENQERFVRTQIITSEVNTGISANLNRAEAACQGEWVKGIAGDDLLMPNCINECLECVRTNKDISFLFGQMQVFDADKLVCEEKELEICRYNNMMSRLSNEQQLNVIIEGNCPPAPTLFYKLTSVNSMLCHNDERIKCIEDWPKWIRILQSGARLHFMEKKIVRYRMGGVSSSALWYSMQLFRDRRMVYYYYIWDILSDKDTDLLRKKTIDFECELYNVILEMDERIKTIKKSKSYRLGKMILRPFKKIYMILSH